MAICNCRLSKPKHEDTMCGGFNIVSGDIFTIFRSHNSGTICGSLNISLNCGSVSITLNFIGENPVLKTLTQGNTKSILFDNLDSIILRGNDPLNSGKYCIVSKENFCGALFNASDDQNPPLDDIFIPDINLTKVADRLIYSQIDEVINFNDVLTNTGNTELDRFELLNRIRGAANSAEPIFPPKVFPHKIFNFKEHYTVTYEDIINGKIIHTTIVTAMYQEIKVSASATVIVYYAPPIKPIESPSIALTLPVNKKSTNVISATVIYDWMIISSKHGVNIKLI